jgi:hypothetical protein
MFKNYFIVAFRNFWRNKIFSVINITGLAIGISASLVIYLLVYYDFTFDKFEKDGDRIYRVVSDFTFGDESFKNSGVPSPMPAAVRNEVTGLDVVAPFRTWNNNSKISVPSPNRNPVVFKKQNNIVYADENYFKLLQYTWLAGSPKTSLQQPYQVVLTESNAKLFFPKLNAAEIIGKQIIFNDTVLTTVTGVVKDIEQNTERSATSLSEAGKWIGIFERILVLTFVINNHFEGIGFLIAAKSILRFNDIKGDNMRKEAEYILIGTLMSFASSILIGIFVNLVLK